LLGHNLVCVVMTSCDKIETIIDSLKVTGAKGDRCPGSFMSTGANAPVAPVESAPMIGTKPLSLTVSEIFNVKCNAVVDVTLIRPLNKGQGHSFWYQSISHTRLPIGSQ